MNVTNAFLHGNLLEDVYMKIPLGYTGPGHGERNSLTLHLTQQK